MLYFMLRQLVRLTTRLYFRNFQVNGKENIPADGPCILVANHPATFMDAFLVAAHTRQKVYFLSKATVFRSRLAAWILPRLNMIPVYRRQDDATQVGKNADTFDKCYGILQKNKPILVFPEGISESGRKLHQLKTGAARMALGALERGQHDIKIVCIGLNYEKNGTFHSNAVMEIAPAINVKEWLAQQNLPVGQAAKKLTAFIAQTLSGITVSIETRETDEFVSRIEEMYKPVLMDELSWDKKDKTNDFFLTRKIVEYTGEVRQSDPWKLYQIKTQVDEYFGLLGRYRISDTELRGVHNRRFFPGRLAAGLLYLLAGLPLFLLGLAVNALPYLVTMKVSRSMSRHIGFRVAISFSAGIFIYAAFYALWLWGISCFTGAWWMLAVVPVVFPLSGLFAYLYWNYLARLRKKWKVFVLMSSDTEGMTGLYTLRKKIIGELERIRLPEAAF